MTAYALIANIARITARMRGRSTSASVTQEERFEVWDERGGRTVYRTGRIGAIVRPTTKNPMRRRSSSGAWRARQNAIGSARQDQAEDDSPVVADLLPAVEGGEGASFTSKPDHQVDRDQPHCGADRYSHGHPEEASRSRRLECPRKVAEEEPDERRREGVDRQTTGGAAPGSLRARERHRTSAQIGVFAKKTATSRKKAPRCSTRSSRRAPSRR